MNSLKSVLPKNSDRATPFEDPIVKEVRESRHQLASALGCDLEKIGTDLIRRQTQLGKRLRTSAK